MRGDQRVQTLSRITGLVGLAVATGILSGPARSADWQPRSGDLPLTPSVSQVPAPNLSAERTGPQATVTTAEPGVVTPVAAVDLGRYVGLWYEIARVPAWFQSRCERQTTAQYQLRDDGRITVLNQCIKRNGTVDRARGLARVIDRSTNSRLQVSFVSVLGWRPFWGDYWVLALDPEYRWAVIGDPRRRYGWILSRSPQMDAATLNLCFQALERNGYQRSRFVLTPQSPVDEQGMTVLKRPLTLRV
jgi:apolipoprotein D and lipocalin family protein